MGTTTKQTSPVSQLMPAEMAKALTLLSSGWVARGMHFGNLVHTDALSL